MSLARMLREKRLAVLVGPGGVGKTTISAACALEAARTREALALTVDPARRLADAMGVRLGGRAVRVHGKLSAGMLDTKQALDDLVARYAPSPERLRRILRSPFYAQLSDAFAGSEEFVSAGALYEYLQDGAYGIVVLDTPPGRHALDLLEVPARLVRVFESGAVRWLVRPSRVLRLAGGRAAGLLARWASQEYLEDAADFLGGFDTMFEELEGRARTMRAILGDASQTGIAVVAAPEPASLLAARALHREITERLRMPVDALVVNRVLGPPPRATGLAEGELGALLAAVLRKSPGVPAGLADELARGVAAGAERYRATVAAQEEAIGAFTRDLGCEVLEAPALPEPVGSLEALERLRASLFGP